MHEFPFKIGDRVRLTTGERLTGTVDGVFAGSGNWHEVPSADWAWVKWDNGNDGAVPLSLLEAYQF